MLKSLFQKFKPCQALGPVCDLNYFDLGMHEGQEIALFLEAIKDLSFLRSVNVYGIEASPQTFAKAVSKFHDEGRVRFHFFNFAVGSSEGVADLYLHPSSLGHSLYADKRGVTEAKIKVLTMRFSVFLKQIEGLPGAVNILKANIEGAEWDLLQDLAEHKLLSLFNLYLSSSEGQFSDIGKIPSLVNQNSPVRSRQILDAHHVQVRRFCFKQSNQANVDLAKAIRELAQNK